MLVIRLARTGKKHQAYFRIVVAESKRAVTAKFIEILGNYDPHAKKLAINVEQLQKYLKNGAQPSEAVARLLMKEKIELPKWVKVTEKKKAPKKEPEVKAPAAEPKAEAAEENTEAPAEEAPVENVETAETPEVAEEAPAEAGEPNETAEEAAEEAAPQEDSNKKEEGETSKE